MSVLTKGTNCVSCGEDVSNIVDLVDHECDSILNAEELSRRERSTLMYIESRIVDQGATLDLEQMNMDDESHIKLFRAAGLLETREELRGRRTVKLVTKFTDDAWDLAAACRKLRGQEEIHDDSE